MRAQAASTERASSCRDTGLSDVRRAEAVSTTSVANAEVNSTNRRRHMHATLPLKNTSSPGRGRRDATPCGRVEGEGAAVAPAAADATDWARTWYALSTTRDASRAAVFAYLISSSNRCRCASRRTIVSLASSSAHSSAHWARAAAYDKSEGPAWAPRSREL